MPTFQCVIMGVDVSDLVVDLGTIEEVQSTLFSNNQLFSGEQTITLDNSKGHFTPTGAGSLFSTPWFNASVAIYRNDVLVFTGLVQGLSIPPEKSQAILKVVNALAPLGDRAVDLVAEGVGPAAAILSILEQIGMRYFVDEHTFLTADLPARLAGATISINFPASSLTSGLQAMQAIADACSLDIVTNGTIIYCRPFAAYPGHESDLRAEVDEDSIRSMASDDYDRRALANRVEVTWGANKLHIVEDQDAQGQQGQQGAPSTIVTTISAGAGSNVAISDEVSAAYFGGLMLARTSNIPRQISVTLDPKFDSISVGDKHPITVASQGLDRTPMRAISVRRTFTSDESDVSFVSLSRSQK